MGYQTAPTVGIPDFIRFNHDRCFTSLSLPLESFRELTGEPLLGDFCAETRQTEHCLAFHACQTFLLKCVCAFVWRVSEIIRTWSNKKDQGFTRIGVQTNSQSNLGNERESWVQPTTASDGEEGREKRLGTT